MLSVPLCVITRARNLAFLSAVPSDDLLFGGFVLIYVDVVIVDALLIE